MVLANCLLERVKLEHTQIGKNLALLLVRGSGGLRCTTQVCSFLLELFEGVRASYRHSA